MQFGVNHLGHWALTAQLMSGIIGSPNGPSGDRDDYVALHGQDGGSKEAGAHAMSLLAHPGLSQTDLQSRILREGASNTLGGLSYKAADLIGMNAEVGAMPQLRAATDPTS
jgi:hypothetical protein